MERQGNNASLAKNVSFAGIKPTAMTLMEMSTCGWRHAYIASFQKLAELTHKTWVTENMGLAEPNLKGLMMP